MAFFDDLTINVSIDGETFHSVNILKNDTSSIIVDKVIKEFKDFYLSYANFALTKNMILR